MSKPIPKTLNIYEGIFLFLFENVVYYNYLQITWDKFSLLFLSKSDFEDLLVFNISFNFIFSNSLVFASILFG